MYWLGSLQCPSLGYRAYHKQRKLCLTVSQSSTSDQKKKKEAMSKYLVAVGQTVLNGQHQYKEGSALHRYTFHYY
jgi:hypothetical protein